MKIGRLLFSAPVIVFTIALITACATGTPTPTVAPPVPTATPTATLPPPTPTFTPTPTSTPTATPPPTATPTPTPPPSIDQGIEAAKQAMVKLTAGGSSWSGVMIDAGGLILTTSTPLGTAPLLNFTTFGGQTGQAWVIGRDDAIDLALLQVINPSTTYAAAEVALEEAPERSEPMALLQYTPSGTVPVSGTSAVVGVDGSTGVEYIQVQGFSAGTEHGGGVFDASGRLRGLRMNIDNMIALGVGRSGQAWAMSAFDLAASIIPRLQSGYTYVSAVPGGCTNPFAFPPIPTIMVGDATIGGTPAPVGTQIYARVVKASGVSVWVPQAVTTTGRYFILVSICDDAYNGATVEFWSNMAKSPVTTTYAPGEKRQPLITFP